MRYSVRNADVSRSPHNVVNLFNTEKMQTNRLKIDIVETLMHVKALVMYAVTLMFNVYGDL